MENHNSSDRNLFWNGVLIGLGAYLVSVLILAVWTWTRSASQMAFTDALTGFAIMAGVIWLPCVFIAGRIMSRRGLKSGLWFIGAVLVVTVLGVGGCMTALTAMNTPA